MKPFLSQTIDMQISQENGYAGLSIMSNQDEKFDTFLKKHFEFPSDNFNEIIAFISKDREMKKIICNLPKIITEELEYDKLSLDFMKETDPNEKILEIIIYSDLNEGILLKKEDAISDGIINKFPNTTNEYIILVEPYA